MGYYQAKINLLHAISPGLGGRAALKLFTTPVARKAKKPPPVMKHAHQLGMVFNKTKLFGYSWQAKAPVKGKLLILHGYGSRIASFEGIIGLGRRLGYEVVGFDAPGHGKSEGRQLNVVEYTNLINQIRQHYGPFDAYVAHSLGGLALMLALEQKPLNEQAKIALVCPATESTTAARLFFEFMDLPGAVRNSFHKEIEKRAGVGIDWYSVSRVIASIDAAILWIHEETDEVTPLDDVKPVVALQLPNITFHFTNGYNHSGIYRQHEVKQRIEQFLL